MTWNTETEPAAILAKANAGQPLTVSEIQRLAEASGEVVPKKRRFLQIAEAAEQKFAAGLMDVLDLEPVLGPVVRRRRRIVERA